jgi:hypothetical protein
VTQENRRSKLIMQLQQTNGEQEAVIRSMIRSLGAYGMRDEQFREIFKGVHARTHQHARAAPLRPARCA